MKTVKDFIETIKDDKIRQAALNNLTRPNMQAADLNAALFYGFDWSSTPEGYEYWFTIYTSKLETK